METEMGPIRFPGQHQKIQKMVAEGLHEYLRDKAVWMELSGGTRDPFVLG
jgi:hypothetical protein